MNTYRIYSFTNHKLGDHIKVYNDDLYGSYNINTNNLLLNCDEYDGVEFLFFGEKYTKPFMDDIYKMHYKFIKEINENKLNF